MRTLIIVCPNPALDFFSGGVSESVRTEQLARWSFEYIVSTDGLTIEEHNRAPLSQIPKIEKTLLLVPASALAWHTLVLPPVNKTQLQAALWGALEEHILGDVSNTALALSPNFEANKKCVVASISKNYLKSIIIYVEQQGHAVQQVIPQFAPTLDPLQDIQWFATEDIALRDDQPWLYGVQAYAVTGVPLSKHDNIHALLAVLNTPRSASTTPDTPSVPLPNPITATPFAAQIAQSLFDASTITITSSPALLLQANKTAWNLAQFDLSLSHQASTWQKFILRFQNFLRSKDWVLVRWGLISLLVVNLIAINAFAYIEKRKLESKHQQAKQIVQQTFPNIALILDAPVQMKAELARAKTQAGVKPKNDALLMLSLVAQSLTDAARTHHLTDEQIPKIAALEYQAIGSDLICDFQSDILSVKVEFIQSALAHMQGLGYSVTVEGTRWHIRSQLI